MIVTIEVDGAENLSWQPVDHPVKIDIKVLSITDDSLEIEYHQKKVRLIRLW